MSWSFIICTDWISNLRFIPLIIDSIRRQNIPNYEILFTVEKNTPFFLNEKDVKVIYVDTYKNKQFLDDDSESHSCLVSHQYHSSHLSSLSSLVSLNQCLIPQFAWAQRARTHSAQRGRRVLRMLLVMVRLRVRRLK